MSKVLGVCVLTLTLSGCFFQSVSIDKIDAAKSLCKHYDSNLYKVYEYWSGNTDVRCVDETLKQKEYNLDNYLHYKELEKVSGGEYGKE